MDRRERRAQRVHRAQKREFGETVIYEPQVLEGAGFEVVGVYQDPHREVVLVSESPISSTSPTMGVELRDFAPHGVKPEIGDLLERQKTQERYRVADVQPDGEGWAELILHRV
jgi:hypothetical protein